VSDVNKFILLAAVDNRPALLSACLQSLSVLHGWKLMFVGQEFSEERKGEVRSLMPPDSFCIWLPEKVGMHNAKLHGLTEIQKMSRLHVVASIDDDMELLATTHFDRMAAISRSKGVGLVSGNWVRSEKQIAKKKIVDSIKRQAIVYTAGGLVFSEGITKHIVGLGLRDFWCDNTEWSLASYLNGYENFRFLGSLAIHRIMSAGGRKSYVDRERETPNPKYISLRPCKQATSGVNGFHVPDQGDLTQFARFTHQVHKKR